MHLETCWKLEDAGIQNPTLMSQRLQVMILRSSDVYPIIIIQHCGRPNIAMSPGVVYRILGLKAKMTYSSKGEDVRTRIGEKAKARIGIEFYLFLYSFLVFLILICMDPTNMYSFSIMN